MVKLSLCALTKNLMKILNVAEKNDAAKTISNLLSRGHVNRREGFSQYNKIYEFDCRLQNQNVKMVMTSVSGHLLGFEFSSSYRSWQSCDPKQLFDAPVMKQCPENMQKIRKTLEREVRGCARLIIWTDCDREGENIGYEIIDVCRAIKPNIQVQRAKFSEITEQSVFRALNNLVEPDKRQSDAVDVRSELDLRIGAAFTRYQTLRLQKAFPSDVTSLISYGSCQFPTLGFVAQRYREIENFIPQNFWKIKVTHTVKDITTEFVWARNRLFDKAACEALLMVCQSNPTFEVTGVISKPKNKWRPVAMDTVELEKLGSRKLKLSAKTTMTIAEKLYTGGYISYPRTETNIFSKEIDLVHLVQLHTNHPEWGEFSSKVLNWGPNPRNGKKSDQAHPPIHPTKLATDLQGNEKKVYDLITRHFLACVSKDAVGSETIITIKITGEEFTANGLIVLERNYLEVYPYEKWTSKEIYDYKMGDQYEPTELGMHEGATTAPNLLTEADLVSLMEKHGIGTDATHAEHINTIKERAYIGEQGAFLIPGTLGMGLVEGFEAMTLTLAEPKLRAGLELELKQICDGTKNPKDVLGNQISLYKDAYRVMVDKIRALDEALSRRLQSQIIEVPTNEIIQSTVEIVTKCNKCQTSNIVLKKKKNGNGYFLTCDGYPNCKNSVWLPEDLEQIDVLESKCDKCGNIRNKMKFRLSVHMMRIMGATSREYTTCIFCDRNFLNSLALNMEPLTKVYDDLNVNNGYNQPPPPGNSFSTQPRNNQPRAPTAVGWNNPPTTVNGNNHRNTGNNTRNTGPNPRNTGTNSRNNTNIGDNPIKCHKCGKMSKVLTVKKDGPNKGRKFHLCDPCGFIKFADQVTEADLAGAGGGGGSGSSTTTNTTSCFILCQITASLISVSTQKNGAMPDLQAGSDDILQSVHLQIPQELADEDYVTSDQDYDSIENNIDVSSNSPDMLKSENSESTTEANQESSTTEPSSSTSESPSSELPSSTISEWSTDQTSTSESTIEQSTTTTIVSTTDVSSTTEEKLPPMCDYLYTSDFVLEFPPKVDESETLTKISWCFELQEGPGIDIYLDYLNINAKTDYLLIKAGHGEEGENESGQLLTGQQSNLTFKIIHTNKAFIFLSYNETQKPEKFGLKLVVTSYGEFPTTTTPPETTVPSYIGKMKTITKSLTVAKELQHNGTEIWDITLRNSLVEATNLWREFHNYSIFLEECRRENVIFDRITPCPTSWPDHENCVRIEFGIPLNETDHDEELVPDLSAEYELDEIHLEQVWNEFAVDKLKEHGMTEYFLPNATFILFQWVSISVLIVILFVGVLYSIWKIELFKGYKRMDEESETRKAPEQDKKQNDLSNFPTPFLFGEDTFPDEFQTDYGHDMSAIMEDTIYDVRSQPTSPQLPGKRTVNFASNVENINDKRAYTNPFANEIEASESNFRNGYQDSEC
uniref:DNA topoisomerase n=1 Tax=Culicoides sonorensis TaxID=179676 RepID=A0A336L9Q8_CULSO